jgi:hypothetical protein
MTSRLRSTPVPRHDGVAHDRQAARWQLPDAVLRQHGQGPESRAYRPRSDNGRPSCGSTHVRRDSAAVQ